MKIYYRSGDIIYIDNMYVMIHISHDIPYAVYMDDTFHYTNLYQLLKKYSDYYYYRLFNPIHTRSLDSIIHFLKNVSSDISVSYMIQQELQIPNTTNKNTSLIYYIYHSLGYIQNDTSHLDSPDFITTLSFKNNSFLDEIYLNI